MLSIITTLTAIAVVFTRPAFADTQCTPIYGGGENCIQTNKLLMDKTVQNPSTKEFVNNLGVNDPKYGPTGTVVFKLTVKNNNTTALTNVKVTDVFPQYIDYVSGGQSYDSGTKTMTITIDKLNPGETKTFEITGKVVAANNLPSDRGITCVINQAAATVGNETSQDNAQLCVEKNVLTSTTNPTTTKGGLTVYPAPVVTQTPPTGPEALALFALLPAGATGFFLRKRSSQ
jgi:uncharacterized repeat protein (TIGR01451 family)